MASGLQRTTAVCLFCLNENYRDSGILGAFCYGEHGGYCWEVKAYWSSRDNYVEVVYKYPYKCSNVRPYSNSKKFSLCRHFWNCQRGDSCAYAHSVKELDNWNATCLHGSMRNTSTQRSLPMHQAIPERENPTVKHQHQVSRTRTEVFNIGRDELPKGRSEVRSSVLASSTEVHNVSTSGRVTCSDQENKPQKRSRVVEDDVKIEAIQLSNRTYKQKFIKLLQLEQQAHQEKLRSICDGDCYFHKLEVKNIPHCTFTPQYKSYGYITGMKGDAINYGSRASDGTVNMTLNSTVIIGDILSCNLKSPHDKLYLGFHHSLHIQDNQKVSLTFPLKNSYFHRLVDIVSVVNENMISRIIPDSCTFVENEKTQRSRNFSSNLSPKQVAALEAVVSTRKGAPPVLVTGSFGCGKTHVLAKSVLTFLSEDKEDFGIVHILVGTQQHVSADNFLKLFLQFQIKKDPELVVVRLIPSNYNIQCRRSDRQYFKAVNEIKFEDWSTKKKVLVITTCSTSYTAFKNFVIPRKYFTHVLLDECAQMREPEAIAPLCLAHPEAKLAMAGDLQQVGPSTLVMGEEPRNYGLAVSLIERLHTSYKKCDNSSQHYLCELTENYRCHKEIVNFCNMNFYDGVRLTSNIEATKFPMQFVCSSMELKMDPTEHSRVYEEEAAIIVEELCKVYEYWPKDKWGQEKDCSQIVVAGATRAQLSEVEKRLQGYSSDLQLTRRVPTNDIQGKEYRAVIISTFEPTQSNGLPLSMTDSICIPQVFNTVVSRARSLVIVVGNPLALLVKEKCILGNNGRFWKSYLRLCLLNGTLQTDYVSKKSPHVHSVFMGALRGLLQDSHEDSSNKKGNANIF